MDNPYKVIVRDVNGNTLLRVANREEGWAVEESDDAFSRISWDGIEAHISGGGGAVVVTVNLDESDES